MGIADGGEETGAIIVMHMGYLMVVVCSFVQAILKVIVMMLVNWLYALICIGIVLIVWIYVGIANPSVKPGLAAEFQLFVWLKSLVFRCFG